ncbi:hypothetical protein EZV62_015324 [Acer yangbiense]|uniref:Acid phosphatase n=1 Tax=Acer yangbiense TaxID=1000413 RepID=A0A5C7HL36_9ROSI|nr:hypothetical protein EZV62_015324 [Acer yangbiense]
MQSIRGVLLFLFLAIFSKAISMKSSYNSRATVPSDSSNYCLSWQLAMEANNVCAWRTVPTQCLRYMESYMIGGQYDRDVELIVEQILSYVNQIVLSDNGMDAWILDVDDTCISNVFYYRGKQYGEYSTQLNASRIKVLQGQDDVVNDMKESASKELLRVSNDKKGYKILVKGLIVQEPSVLLRCREVDKKVVESIVEDAKREYAEKAKVQPPKLTIDDKVFLPPPPSKADSHEPYCSGGVVLASQDGKIVCENTLDARLNVVFRQKLPEDGNGQREKCSGVQVRNSETIDGRRIHTMGKCGRPME